MYVIESLGREISSWDGVLHYQD